MNETDAYETTNCLCLIAGIAVEGLGSFIDAILGTGNGTTSTSINVGVIGITKVKIVIILEF